uniref:Uncharacterized protein n=1 Tax=Glossina austeni TaxID=7395 RepID=A0A1A9VN89_GLOAU
MRSSIEENDGVDVGTTSSMLCSGTTLDITLNAIATFLRSSEMLYETVGSFAEDSWKVSFVVNLWRPSDDSSILRSKSNLSFILDSLLIICSNNVVEFPRTFDIEFLLSLSVCICNHRFELVPALENGAPGETIARLCRSSLVSHAAFNSPAVRSKKWIDAESFAPEEVYSSGTCIKILLNGIHVHVHIS